MVTDLVGSTELRIRLGEDRAEALRRIHDAFLREAVETKNGTVIKGLGDGVLAMFSSASDAVSAAVEVQRAAYAHTRDNPDQPLEIRVGISAGDLTLEDDDCFGTPVVEASRLCGVALGGQILAAELIRLLARGRGGHVFTASGERELKGLPDPVSVVAVVWEPPAPKTSRVPFPARLSGSTPLPFSGRRMQFDSLLQSWKETSDGERRVVLISGEPGIGKSRLTAEVARQAHDLGAVVLFGRCDEDMGVPYQPFVEALEQVVEAGASADSFGRHAGELVRLVPGLTGLIPGLDPPLQADPETERYRLFDALLAWLGALSRSSGLVLVLDDLHWAEKPTLLLLRHIVQSIDPMRLLVIGTYRDTDLDRSHPLAEMLADMRRMPRIERLPLKGLDVAGVSELMANSGGSKTDPRLAELAQLIWSETEGNPFFVQEVLLSLVEVGHLVQRDGVWTTDFDVAELGIPEGVREVVGRRLSRLTERANDVLALASVIGTTVDVGVLAQVANVDYADVLDALDEAVSASLLRETAEGTYEFTHGLVRSTLYSELSSTRRAHRHRQVAHALESNRDADAAVLAYHFQRAGKSDARGIDYAAAAGEQALEKLAFDQAGNFFHQALEMAEDLDVPALVQCRLLSRLGVAQRLAADPVYRETLLQASAMAKSLGEAELQATAVLANSRGLWSTVGSLDAERVESIEHALEAIGAEDSVFRARLLALLALELAWSDPELRRIEIADEAIAIARRLGDEACLLEVWTAGHLSTKVAARVPTLASEAPALVALAERIGNAEQIMLACAWGFSNLLEIGDLEACDRMLDRMHAIAEDLNSPVFRWLGQSFHCCRMTVSALGDEIEEAATKAIALGEEAAQPDAMVWFAAQFFNARWFQGRLGEVLDLVRQQVADNPGIPGWMGVLALSLVTCGEIEAATEYVAELPTDLTQLFPDDLIWLVGHSLLVECGGRGRLTRASRPVRLHP